MAWCIRESRKSPKPDIHIHNQRKNDASSLSDEHQEERSKNRGRQLRESMSVDADNPVDTLRG